MKNLAYIVGILAHLSLAQWAFMQAGKSNACMRACGSEWVKSAPCDNPFSGQYDKYMAVAWFEAALLVFAFAWILQLSVVSKVIGAFFAFSTYNNMADQILLDPFTMKLSEWLSLATFVIFALIILIRWIVIWYKKSRIF